MMIVDHSYKVSAFGNFENILPTSENMMYFLEAFDCCKMVPSVATEGAFNVKTQQQLVTQRLSFISNDSRERVVIASGRIDYEVNATDDIKLDVSQRESLNKKILFVFKTIFERFDIQSSRLALNPSSIITNLTDDEYMQIMKKYHNPISIYTPTDLSEWGTRLLVCKDIVINGKTEVLNVITQIDLEIAQKAEAGVLKEDHVFVVTLDINTSQNNRNIRFSAVELEEFISQANSIWDKIIDEVG
ncbi:MAG: hypothetical protein RR053_06770 [Evtepia sp.]